MCVLCVQRDDYYDRFLLQVYIHIEAFKGHQKREHIGNYMNGAEINKYDAWL